MHIVRKASRPQREVPDGLAAASSVPAEAGAGGGAAPALSPVQFAHTQVRCARSALRSPATMRSCAACNPWPQQSLFHFAHHLCISLACIALSDSLPSTLSARRKCVLASNGTL